MKKFFLVLFMAYLFVTSFGGRVLGYSPHYLPGGENYLSEENYESTGEWYIAKEPFLVKPYTDYLLTVTRDFIDDMGVVEFIEYHNGIGIGSITYTDEEFTINPVENLYHLNFHTGVNTNYLQLDFLYTTSIQSSGLAGFMLEEGTEYDGYEPYIEGTVLDTTAPYFQSAGTIISYVDSPISVAEIQSALKAYDSIDGDVSDSIIVVEDNYTDYAFTLGTYSVVFGVSDSSFNLSELEVWINVVDAVKPMFSDIGVVKAVYPSVYTADEVRAMLTASDNYDGTLTDSIVLVADGYTTSSQELGTYEMEFSVSDSSGNTAYHTVVIEVIDSEAPLIDGIDSIVVNYDTLLSLDEIKNNLEVIDNYDGHTLELEVVANDYFDNFNMLGIYSIVFGVSDSSGNRTEKSVQIEVVDNIGPMVYFDYSVIQVYNDTVLALGDIASLLSRSNELEPGESYDVSVMFDSYSKNASRPGTYHLALDFEDSKGNVYSKTLQINVRKKTADYSYQAPEMEENASGNFLEEEWQVIVGGGVFFLLVASNVLWFIISRKRRL